MQCEITSSHISYGQLDIYRDVAYVLRLLDSVCPSVCISVCTSVSMSICLFVYLFARLFLYLSACPFVCLSGCPSVCMSICLFIRMSAHPFVCLPVCPSDGMYLCPSACISVFLSVCLFVCLSVYLYVCLPVCISASLPVRLYVCPSVCPHVCPSVFMSVSPSVLLSSFLLAANPTVRYFLQKHSHPHPGDPNGGVVYSGLFFPHRICLEFVPVFGKRLSMKSNNVVVFLFDFHIAVQRPPQTLWSRRLLQDHEPSAVSFAPCFKSLLTNCFRRQSGLYWCSFSEASLFVWFYHSVLSGLGDPTGSSNRSSLTVRVTETHKHLQHKVEIAMKGSFCLTKKYIPVLI